jgi:hypothetical protein
VSTATKIEWTRGDDGAAGATWNPVTGCDRISPGCEHCYALRLAARLKAMGQPKYQLDGDPRTSGPGFGVTVHKGALDAPLRWHTPAAGVRQLNVGHRPRPCPGRVHRPDVRGDGAGATAHLPAADLFRASARHYRAGLPFCVADMFAAMRMACLIQPKSIFEARSAVAFT